MNVYQIYTDMNSDIDISVVIATHNRSEVLRKTLEDLTLLNRRTLSVCFVVVDNGSTDDTKKVVESFSDRLPVQYLFESRVGKSCALNCALNNVHFGKIVAFIDDDVTPSKDWLINIISTCKRWPDCGVFGGKIELLWPRRSLPRWVQIKAVQEGVFGLHDHGSSECQYPSDQYPYGANYWVRSAVLTPQRRFSESLGPNKAKGGEDTLFFSQLAKEGIGIVYSPEAVVWHRIQINDISEKRVLQRAMSSAQLTPYLEGLCRRELLEKNAPLWYLLRMGALAWAAVRYVQPMCFLSRYDGMEKAITAAADTGYNLESLKIAWKRKKKAASVVELQ